MVGGVAGAIALALLLALPPALALEVFEANTIADTGPATTTAIWSGQSVAQSFNVTETHFIDQVALRILDPRAPPNTLTVEIHADAGGVPDATALASTTGSVPNINVWYWWNFTFSPRPRVVAGGTYWIVALDPSANFGRGYVWDRSGSNVYGGGTAALRLSGGSWTPFDDDQLFVDYGTASSAKMTLAMAGNLTVASPGDDVQYRIYYNNTGSGTAQRVWINDTLPAGLLFRSANPAPDTVAGNVVRWSFPAVPPGPGLIVLNGSFSPGVLDGATITNAATLEYRNESGVPGSPQAASFGTTIRAPSFLLSKSADRAILGPGEEVTFTIGFVNVGSRAAARVDVEDPLPPELIFLNSTAEGDRTGDGLWTFYDVGPGSRAFEIRARLAYNASQAAITNGATLRSYNTRGQLLQTLTDFAVLLPGLPPKPEFSLGITATPQGTRPGGDVGIALWYANTGGRARDLWINLTLPGDLDFLWAAPAPSGGPPTALVWHFTDVGPGNYSITIALRAAANPERRQVVVVAALSATDGLGRSAGSMSTVVLVEIEGGLGTTALLLLGGIVALLGTLLAVFLFRRPLAALIARYRGVFDEIFLLHRSGLLIRHYSRSIRPEVDSDVIGAMLVAVQDFVKDSFRGQGLEELKVGRARLLIARGKECILAAAVTGGRTAKLGALLASAVDTLEARCGDALANWNGVVEELQGVDEVIKGLLVGHVRPQRVPRFRGPRRGRPPLEELSISGK